MPPSAHLQKDMLMKTILVVDDSKLIQWSLKTTLEAGRFQVEICEDGAAALARIEAGLRPDLILTDLNMPNMNGIELTKAVRTRLRFTPIVLVSTESQMARKEEAKRAGATGWLVKPVKPEELRRIVDKLMPVAA